MPGMKLPHADAEEAQSIGYVNGESSGAAQVVEDSQQETAEAVASDVAVGK